MLPVRSLLTDYRGMSNVCLLGAVHGSWGSVA